MKKIIKKWLGIPNECQHTCLTIDTVEKLIDDAVAQYSETSCSTCGKKIIAHRGGFYRNAEGRVYCSHKCFPNETR